ncbi:MULTISPECIES: response regulator [Asticcacaulis]|uniref:response regulator n=1 Tax=Asticcacaulis TaxID=76890 RepID=UPI001AE3BAEF|nr:MULTISPECIES: response regulator [Asticcacaulis]MBP2160432.1 CheY-like chemotaxis protein [Asticcacaulis solisilvae]MDR6801477.1 CheY-like chemotaxis protein [Asticcacaulis sp. BE141]
MPSQHFTQFERSRLLVVDDDPILREFAVCNLKSDKVSVVTAGDGAEALHLLTRLEFDIALVDLDMPIMDGFELIGLVRADTRLRHLPIVVATGREDMDSVDKAYASGATSFVVKPLNWRLIAHQLSYVLRANREEALVRQTLKNLQQANAAHREILDRAIRRLERAAVQPQAEEMQRLALELSAAVTLVSTCT